MSSSGINPLAILAPDLYAKQLAIQRQQAYAQALLQQGAGNSGDQPYGGLRNAGNSILGAFLAKRADKATADLYSPQASSDTPPLGQQPVPEPQISNNPGNGPTMSNTNLDPEGNPAPQAPAATAMGSALQNKPAQSQARTIPNVLGGAIPDLPGLTHQQSLLAYAQSPQAYFTALAAANAPTNEEKNARYVSGGNEDVARSFVQGALNKAGTTNITRGMAITPTGERIYAPPPAPPGYQYVNGPDNLPHLMPVDNGTSAVAGSSYAQNLGKAATTPATAYGANNLPVASNQAVMSGNGPAAQAMIPGMNPGATQAVESRGNPMAVSPAGAVGPMQTMPGTLQSPGFGVRPAKNNSPQEQGRVGTDYLGAMIQHYGNPVLGHIAYNMGPQKTDQWLNAGGDFAKLPLETQTYLGRIAVAQALPQRGSQPISQVAPLRPELPAGQATYMQSQGKDAADRHDATVAAASESPMRINVLDNIINLSKAGVATGPGQEFQNSILGYAANVPGLSKIMGGAKDNVAKFQELQKFTYQNAIRSWQAAGGTGTDAQMQSMAHANPNDHLFPQALQQIAQWGKAGELAVQGKANAQDMFLQQNGQTPTAQIKFEQTWRNAFDPKVFQYSLMSPQEKQAFAQQELKTPQAAKAFLAKQQQLKALGAIQ